MVQPVSCWITIIVRLVSTPSGLWAAIAVRMVVAATSTMVVVVVAGVTFVIAALVLATRVAPIPVPASARIAWVTPPIAAAGQDERSGANCSGGG